MSNPSLPSRYPAVLALIAGIVCLAEFAWIAVDVKMEGITHGADQKVWSKARELESNPKTVYFKGLAQLGNGTSLGGLAFVTVVVLIMRGQRRLALIVGLSAASAALLNWGFKEGFQRPRPPDPLAYEISYGYPSGHSLGSMVGYGLLCYLLCLFVVRTAYLRFFVLLGFGIFVFMIGLSRMYLRVHYFSDVMGGFAFGAGWLFLTIAVDQYLRYKEEMAKVSR